MLTNLKTGETTFPGMTLGMSNNVYAGWGSYTDYAEVWTGTEIKSLPYGGGTDGGLEWRSFRVDVDASPEVHALAKAWVAKRDHEAEVSREQARLAAYQVELEKASRLKAKATASRSLDEKTLATIKKGEMVTISSGVSKGFTGIMFWVGSPKESCIRVGVKNAKGEVAWVNARACEKALVAA